MSQAVASLATLVLAILTLLPIGFPSSAVAQTTSTQARPSSRPQSDGADRWIPSLALEGGVSFQKWDSGVSSEVCRGCTIPDPMVEELQPPALGDDRDSTPFIGIQLELTSPELHVPGSPRFFFGAEIAPTFGKERDIAITGIPARTIGSPSDNPSIPFGDTLATGQGAVATMKRDELSFGAWAGLAFPFEAFGRRLEIRPSFNWIRFDVELDGLVSDADCLDVIVGGFEQNRCIGTSGNPAGFLRVTQFSTSTDETFDGIGPGLYIEMEAARVGPIGTTVFGGARFYRILGDKDVEIRSGPITTADELGTDQSAARFGFEVDDWLYRFGVGIRFQWLGDDRPRRR